MIIRTAFTGGPAEALRRFRLSFDISCYEKLVEQLRCSEGVLED